MPCYHPLQAWRGKVRKASGKTEILFKRPKFSPLALSELSLPCGQCSGCRLERSRQWAMRCVHEESLHDASAFITLTFDPRFLPSDGSLCTRTFQLFMKRLRKDVHPVKVRFFHCGEYGTACRGCNLSKMLCTCAVFVPTLGRPHYHAIIFGFGFPDRELWKVKNGNRLYRSAQLERLWPFGHSSVGDVTFDSAAYVARYVMKKISGDMAIDHYEGKKPEYVTMSRRPGIGAGWYKKFGAETYKHDSVVVRGREVPPPKFYDNLFQIEDPVRFEALKRKRLSRLKNLVPLIDRLNGKSAFIENATPDRLRVREFVKNARTKSLVRPLEDGDDN